MDRFEENIHGYEESMANFNLDFDPTHDSDLSDDDEEEEDMFSDDDREPDDDDDDDDDDEDVDGDIDKGASGKSSTSAESEMEEPGDENESDEEDDKLSRLPGIVNLPTPKLGITRKKATKVVRKSDALDAEVLDSPNPGETVQDKKPLEAPDRRGVFRTFTMDSMRGPALLGFGKKQNTGSRTRRGGRRNRGGTKEETTNLSEEVKPPSRRGILRTFTMDSMRGSALLGFGKKKEEKEEVTSEEVHLNKHKKPEGTRTLRGGRRNRGGKSEQKTLSVEGAEFKASDQPPSRRGVLRTFTMDSMRGRALLGFGKKKENEDSKEVDGQEHRKPEGAKTRRGGRRNQGGTKEKASDTNETSESTPAPCRPGVLRTFTMDSMRGAAIFGGGGKRPGGNIDTEKKTSSAEDVKDSFTITKRTRRGGRRPNKQQELADELPTDLTSDGEGSATTDGSNKSQGAEETNTTTAHSPSTQTTVLSTLETS